MPVWNCPTCHQSHEVKATSIGKKVACRNCTIESVVETQAEILAHNAARETVPFINALQVILCLCATVGIVLAIKGFGSGSETKGPNLLEVYIGVGCVFEVLLFWPVTMIATECYRARRMIQEMLKTQ